MSEGLENVNKEPTKPTSLVDETGKNDGHFRFESLAGFVDEEMRKIA